MADVYDSAPPHPCERLARLEGQSNFLSLLAGIEAGPDTTHDAAALSMSRRPWLAPPEMLEAFWGQSTLYRTQICQVIFDMIGEMGSGISDRDRVWVKGAILDAFDVFIGKGRRNGLIRAKALKARAEDYYATRKLAEGLLWSLTSDIQRSWLRARLREN